MVLLQAMLVLHSPHCVLQKSGGCAGRHGQDCAANLSSSHTALFKAGRPPLPHLKAVPEQRRRSVSAAQLGVADLDAGPLTLPLLEVIVLVGT